MALAAAALGCSSSSAAPSVGGPDASEGGQGPSCPIDASITTYEFPDAALGDAGGNAGACGYCLNTKCVSSAQACDDDCSCLETTKAVLECGADGGTAVACANSVGPSDTNFTTLALCIVEFCAGPCALSGVELADAASGEAGGAGDAAAADAGRDATGSENTTAGADAATDAP